MRERVISIVIGAPLLLGLLVWSPWTFTAAVAVLMLTALREFYQACRKTGEDPAEGFGYVAAAIALAAAVPLLDPPGSVPPPALLAGPRSTWLFFFGITVLVIASLAVELPRPNRSPLHNLAPTWFGVLYIGWLFPFAARLRWLPASDLARVGWPVGPRPDWQGVLDPGTALLLLVLLTTWSADTCAFLVGKSIGKHKLAPVLSPGKTWEGAVGGFVGAVGIGIGVGWVLGFPPAWSGTAAALIGLMAVLGDLCKSSIKREVGIKDFGKIIPGHGGALDRFDSLLFTAPTIYFLLMLWPG